MSNKINFDEKLVFDIYGEKSELSLEGLETYYEAIGLPTPWGYARDSFAYGLALKSVGENEKKAETLYWTYKALEMSLSRAKYISVDFGMDYCAPVLNKAQAIMAKNLPNKMLELLMHDSALETYYGEEIREIMGQERSIDPAESEVSTNGQYPNTVRMSMNGKDEEMSLARLTEQYKRQGVPRADLVAKDVFAMMHIGNLKENKKISKEDAKKVYIAFNELEIALRYPDYQNADSYFRSIPEGLSNDEYIKVLAREVPGDLIKLMKADSFINERWGEINSSRPQNDAVPTDPEF